MRLLGKINDGLYWVEKVVLGVSVLGIMVVLLANVFARFIYRSGIPWAEEVGMLLITMICFIGVSYGARSGRHIVMSALYDIAPKKAKKVVMYMVTIYATIACFGLGILGANYVQLAFTSHRTTAALLIPLWIPYLVIPIGFWMASFQYFMLFLKNIQNPKEAYNFLYKEPDSDIDEGDYSEQMTLHDHETGSSV